MPFNDGILKIYEIHDIGKQGMKPKIELKEKSSHYYGFEKIGIQRHYRALQAKKKVSKLVKIWRDEDVEPTDICILEDGKQYECEFVQHEEDEEGIKITKITLERVNEEYAISKDIPS